MSQYTPEQLREQADRHERGSHHLDEVNREIWNEPTRQLRAHAALIEENARLKRHTKAMAELLRNQLETQAAGTWEWKAETESILDAIRAEMEKIK